MIIYILIEYPYKTQKDDADYVGVKGYICTVWSNLVY